MDRLAALQLTSSRCAGGDLWERTYVLLGLDDFYEWVEQDSEVLKAMIDQADATIAQVGPPPKTRIVDLGWSPNKIESSTILEPIMRLYKRTAISAIWSSPAT